MDNYLKAILYTHIIACYICTACYNYIKVVINSFNLVQYEEKGNAKKRDDCFRVCTVGRKRITQETWKRILRKNGQKTLEKRKSQQKVS